METIRQQNDGPDVAEGRRYVFRGDDHYKGRPVGKALGPEADVAEIQNFSDHVLRKESNVTSRFTSFTTEMKIARKFTREADDRRVAKVEIVKLRELEDGGIIRIWNSGQVFEAIKNGPAKLAKQAGDV